MQRNRVVNRGADFGGTQLGLELLAIANAHHIEMVDSLRVRRLKRRNDVSLRRREKFIVAVGKVTPQLVPFMEVPEFNTKKSCLKGIEASVVAFDVVVIL